VPAANSICWLVWHSARIQDAQVAHGYGHTPAEVAKVRVPADVLAGYYHAVHQMMLAYIAGVTDEELARVVDENWSPPVTAAVRLVSIIDDCLQHLGQAAHIRGNAR